MPKGWKVYVLVWFWLGIAFGYNVSAFVTFTVWAIGASTGWLFGPTIRTLRYVAASTLTVVTLVLLGIIAVQSGTRLYRVHFPDGSIVQIEAATNGDAEAAAKDIWDYDLRLGPGGKYHARRSDGVNLQRLAGKCVATLGFVAAVLWNPGFWRKLAAQL